MTVFYTIIFFILGAVLASFYGVVGTRLPEGKSIIKPGSHCDTCNHPLGFLDLIPIFSYIFSKGKCRHCKEKVSIINPITEFITGLLFELAYLHYGLSYHFLISLILISLLILIYITDFKYMIILDSPLVISGISIFFLNLFFYNFKYAIQSLASGLILFLFMLFIAWIGKLLFKREALGGGDIKLAFIIGMVLHVPHAFLALVLSTFLALPYATFSMLSTKEKEVPYGPFLIAALCIVFLFYQKFNYILMLF